MSKEIGTLVVVVLKARHLRDKHTITKQDVYVKATLNKQMKQTATDVKGGQHPVWDEELRFPIVKAANDETRKLEVVIYSKEARQDDLVGKGSVDISDTLKTGEFDDWVQLYLEDGSERGELFLEMTYYANTPPIQRRASKWVPADRLKRGPHGLAVASARKQDALPPLPENVATMVTAAPTPASPPKIPSSLLPGGSGLKRASPKSGASALPSGQPVHTRPPRDTSPLRNGHQSIDNIPAHLRPGGGGGVGRPTHSPHSSITAIPEAQGAAKPSFESLPASLQHGGASYHAPTESIPPYLQPGAGGAHSPGRIPTIPEPHIPTPEIPSYTAHSQPQPYGGDFGSSPYPPQSSYTEYPPHRTQSPPALFVGGISSPPPQQQQQYPTYGSPPRGPYRPLANQPQELSYPPYGAPTAQPYPSYGSPPQPSPPPQTLVPSPQSYPAYGGYPAGRSPPASGLDLPDPYLEKRYHTPLPLPDGSFGRTPSPSSRPPHSKPSTPPALAPQQPAKEAPKPKSPSREERDRTLALEMEKQEEERKRLLREQEERDMELARQLDLELNLESGGGGGGSAAPPAPASLGVGMPGEWCR